MLVSAVLCSQMKTFHAAFLPLCSILVKQNSFFWVQCSAFYLEYCNSQEQSLLSENDKLLKIWPKICYYIFNFLSVSLCFWTGVRIGQDSLIFLVYSSSDHRQLLCLYFTYIQHTSNFWAVLCCTHGHFRAALYKNSLDWAYTVRVLQVYLDDSCWERRDYYLSTQTTRIFDVVFFQNCLEDRDLTILGSFSLWHHPVSLPKILQSNNPFLTPLQRSLIFLPRCCYKFNWKCIK